MSWAAKMSQWNIGLHVERGATFQAESGVHPDSMVAG